MVIPSSLLSNQGEENQIRVLNFNGILNWRTHTNLLSPNIPFCPVTSSLLNSLEDAVSSNANYTYHVHKTSGYFEKLCSLSLQRKKKINQLKRPHQFPDLTKINTLSSKLSSSNKLNRIEQRTQSQPRTSFKSSKKQ